MLGNAPLIAFVGVTDLDRARAFYCETLGLRLVAESPFALEIDAAGTMLRVTKVGEVKPALYTALGWQVPDIRQAVTALTEKGSASRATTGWSRTSSASGPRLAACVWPGSRTPTATRFRSRSFLPPDAS